MKLLNIAIVLVMICSCSRSLEFPEIDISKYPDSFYVSFSHRLSSNLKNESAAYRQPIHNYIVNRSIGFVDGIGNVLSADKLSILIYTNFDDHDPAEICNHLRNLKMIPPKYEITQNKPVQGLDQKQRTAESTENAEENETYTN